MATEIQFDFGFLSIAWLHLTLRDDEDWRCPSCGMGGSTLANSCPWENNGRGFDLCSSCPFSIPWPWSQESFRRRRDQMAAARAAQRS